MTMILKTTWNKYTNMIKKKIKKQMTRGMRQEILSMHSKGFLFNLPCASDSLARVLPYLNKLLYFMHWYPHDARP